MAGNRRHTEFFGPDLGRGPFSSNSPPVAAVQIAAAIAQMRAPLLRTDAELQAHADFIRGIADRLFPDIAAAVRFVVGNESSDSLSTQIFDDSGQFALLHCWLADVKGGGETTLAPDAVTWGPEAVVLQTITTRKRYLIVTPSSGALSVSVSYAGDREWYWAVSRAGRVFYSSELDFDA